MPNEIPGSVTIYVNLEEISAVGESFSFQIGTIVEVILMGPVFALIYFVLMKNLLSKINRETGRNRRLIYILEVAVVGFICMLVMGHIVHLMFDYANAIYRATYHLIHIGFFSFLILAMIGESRIADKRRMRWYEVIIAIGLGAGIFVINGYATYEGQCGWLLMVLSSVLLGIQVGIILLKKVNPLWYPIFFSALLGNIIVIGYYLWYTSVFGTLPYYPFAPQ
ncbi:MAG: hypothetical protein ACTSRL_15540 [Candidatus Helarchaeota archaeon]